MAKSSIRSDTTLAVSQRVGQRFRKLVRELRRRGVVRGSSDVLELLLEAGEARVRALQRPSLGNDPTNGQ